MEHGKIMFQMVKNGFGFSKTAGVKTKKSIENLKTKVEKLLRKETCKTMPNFNPNSLNEQKTLIFDKLKLGPDKGRSLKQEILNEIAKTSYVAELISHHRKLSKANEDIETYLSFEESDRIHSKLSLQHLTGRLTLSDPPLQMVQNPFEINVNRKNVPIKVRNLFRVKDSSRTLISVDYSQVGPVFSILTL